MSTIKMRNNKNETTIGEAFDKFIRLKKIKNVSESTIIYYNNCMKSFSNYYSLDKLITDINQDTYFSYIEFLQSKEDKLTDVSINSYLRGLRVFLKYCMSEKYIETFKVDLIKQEDVIKEPYFDDELKKLLEKPDLKKCDFSEYRTWVMENFLLGTGVRLSTAISIKICELDFDNFIIKLSKTKNRTQQYIPMSVNLAQILQEYLEYRAGELDDVLFCNRFGKRLTEEGAKTAVQRYNERRGVERTSIHLFRHTFAKLWVVNGGDIFTLQRLLGHKSLEMVRRYVNLYGTEIQKQYTKYNPLDNFIEQKQKSIKLRH